MNKPRAKDIIAHTLGPAACRLIPRMAMRSLRSTAANHAKLQAGKSTLTGKDKLREEAWNCACAQKRCANHLPGGAGTDVPDAKMHPEHLNRLGPSWPVTKPSCAHSRPCRTNKQIDGKSGTTPLPEQL